MNRLRPALKNDVTARRIGQQMLLNAVERMAAALHFGEPPAICLGFHGVDRTGSKLAVDPHLLRDLMRRLAEDGWQGVSVAERAQQKGKTRRTVVITFDDGFESVWSKALPILDELGFHATVFTISAGIGRRSAWTAAGRSLPPEDLLSTSQLRELVQAGWEIGAHTRNHTYLPELHGPQLDDEIGGGRRDLEDLLGIRVDTFAYPYGGCSPKVVAAVEAAGFQTAWTTRPGSLEDGSSPLLLPRYMVPPWASAAFGRAASGWLLALLYGWSAQLDRLLGRPPRYARVEPGTNCSRFTDAR